jgi:hypothetical protein
MIGNRNIRIAQLESRQAAALARLEQLQARGVTTIPVPDVRALMLTGTATPKESAADDDFPQTTGGRKY